MESKSFEIFVELIRGSFKGRVVERSRGLSRWIKFGEKSLSWLLEGVELCCKEKVVTKELGGVLHVSEWHRNCLCVKSSVAMGQGVFFIPWYALKNQKNSFWFFLVNRRCRTVLQRKSWTKEGGGEYSFWFFLKERVSLAKKLHYMGVSCFIRESLPFADG